MGVGEGLDEHAFGQPLVARGKHYIHKNAQDNPTQRRLGAQELYMGPLFMFQSTPISLEDWLSLEQGKKELSLLKTGLALPDNIHLMTIENWDAPESDQASELLLRFENMFENTEGDTTQVEIPEDMFVGLNIIEMVELSLGGDRPVEDVMNKFPWSKSTSNVRKSQYSPNTNLQNQNQQTLTFLSLTI